MTFENNKQKYISMFSVLSAAILLLSISGTHSAFADTPIDTTDYFGQALKIFNDQQKLVNEVKGFEQQISNLQLSNSNTPTIASKISDLQKQVDVDNKQIDIDAKEIKRLEALNIKSYQVDPQTAKKLSDAEKAIHDKYIGNVTSVYSNSPVQLVYADFKYRNIVVMLDPTQVKGNPESLAANVLGQNGTTTLIPLDAKTLQSVEPTKDVPIDIKYGKITPASCTSQFTVCTPLVGAVSVSNIAVHTLNTLGYRAFSGQQAGFVIAGHTATESNTIVQPYTSNNIIGTVTLKCPTSDCAFVPVSQSTLDNVYINGVTQYAIAANVPRSQQPAGGYVYKSGASTGLTMGTIVGGVQYPDRVLATMNASGGDSGSPVMADLTGTTASLYGMVYGIGGGYTQYIPWDWIQNNQIGVTPS